MNKRLVTLIAGVLIALLIVVGIVAVMISGMKGKEEGISVSADDIQVSIMTTTQAEEEPPAVVTIPEEEKTTDEPEEEVISYFFRTDKQYEEHYQKHGAEFGDITKEQYLEMANELIGSSSETVLHKIEQEDVEKHLFVPDSYFEGSVESFWKNLPSLDAEFEARRRQLDEEGKHWRFVATMDHGKADVSLKEISKDSPFYNLAGSNNIVLLTTERYREYPMLIQGYGAGASVTAAGVFANIMSIANI